MFIILKPLPIVMERNIFKERSLLKFIEKRKKILETSAVLYKS